MTVYVGIRWRPSKRNPGKGTWWALLPGDGLCVARFDDPVVMEVAPLSLCPVQTFGTGPGAMWRLGAVSESEAGFEFEIIYKGRSTGKFSTPMFGEHNLMNLISGIICAVNLGYSLDKVRAITPKFHGAKRRQEVLAREPITLVDDFAHHPTEVAATLSAVRRRYKGGKLFALFEQGRLLQVDRVAGLRQNQQAAVRDLALHHDGGL